MFTGGAFLKRQLFALGIMPYTSASIVVQLWELRPLFAKPK
jgi:preprotein translocase subunit SecY